MTLALLWAAVGAIFYNTAFFTWRPLNWVVDALGGFAVLALSWLLFPAVVTLTMSLLP